MAKFILFEGQDGSTKTTVVRAVERHLIENGKSCLIVEDAGFSDLGMALRPIIEGKGAILEAATWFDIFLAIRRENFSIVNTIKNDYDYILYDRSTPSTLVYNNIFDDVPTCYKEIKKRISFPFDFDLVIHLHDYPLHIEERLIKRPKKVRNDTVDLVRIKDLHDKYDEVMEYLKVQEAYPVVKVQVKDKKETFERCMKLIWSI